MLIKKIQIKNSYVSEILNAISENVNIFFDDFDYGEKISPEKYISEKYCDDIISMGRNHGGLPELEEGISLNNHPKLKESNFHSTVWPKLHTKSIELQQFLGSKHQALFLYYPPEGFIAWHNNADASGHNILFTWSETGDGWFSYRDENNETVKIKDTKGWSCKMNYFPSYDDKKDRTPLYHAAYTKCKRLSIAFRFEENDSYLEDLKKDLEDE